MVVEFIKEAAFFFNEMAIYLVFGFFVAGLLHVFFPEGSVLRHLGKNDLKSTLKSSLFGIPLPLCSCGVIPVAASLRKKGASKGATLSFLISTPQIGADSFLITYSLIGWVFALFRIVASFITALFAGLIVNLFSGSNGERENNEVSSRESSSFRDRLKTLFSYVQFELLGSIAGYLVIGIIVAGAIAIIIPQDFFERYLGNQFLSMVVILLVSIPMYICATASTPIAASLLLKGLSPGAALVFLLAGPATNAVTISTVTKILGKKSTIIYLGAISLVSITLGHILNIVALDKNVTIMHAHAHELLPEWVRLTGSIILFIMLAGHYMTALKSKLQAQKRRADFNEKRGLTVTGMNCTHCSNTVKKAVESVPGTSEVEVDLDLNKVFFKIETDDLLVVKNVIEEKGYQVSS
ncbi:permease [candidate division CSSED10-310 bacterium]|uniref:Permease n=1 Tax=candidate division CSSED10-310 bacterium TaxID=2855610 RepID=A0ABV6YVW2_UNCC1